MPPHAITDACADVRPMRCERGGSAHVEAGSRACRRIRAGESCRWPSARARHQMSAWDGRGEPPLASHSSPPPDPRGRAKGAAAFAVDRATCRPSHGRQRRI
uniref:Uncharacterized protein n=1 Tax=Oryza sativa subsp. japonica TaxID=39947 RepID=Q67WV1_ORYSJ|nr:hypothetical protein [Oryza sativa Japonica Group]